MKNFSDLAGYNKDMEKPTFIKNLGQESENLMTKIFTETCCESCMCQTEEDHKPKE